MIPIVAETTRSFDSDHEEDETITSLTITHADDLNAWRYGIYVGSINETRCQMNSNDTEIKFFCMEHSVRCIKGVAGRSVAIDSSSVISQLTNAISAQNVGWREYFAMVLDMEAARVGSRLERVLSEEWPDVEVNMRVFIGLTNRTSVSLT